MKNRLLWIILGMIVIVLLASCVLSAINGGREAEFNATSTQSSPSVSAATTPRNSLHEHKYTSKVTESTCTEQGYTRYVCNCGDTYQADYAEPLGHSYVKSFTEPTCIEEGYTAHTCSICEDTYKDNIVNALGHSWSDWEVVREPTTESEGSKERVCQICGELETEIIDKLTPEHTHDYSSETVEPTCTDQGYTEYTCDCGDVYRADYRSPLGHTFGSWTTATEATCIATGLEKRVCEDCGGVDARTIDAPGHDYAETVVEATCTEPGSVTKTCKRCGVTEVADTDALGHDWSDWVIIIEPTAESAGQQERTCNRCGEHEVEEIPAVGDTGGEEEYVSYIDPRLEVSVSWFYTTYEYMDISVSIRLGWAGEPPSIWVNDDGSLTVVYINLDGERVETVVDVPPEGYIRMWTLKEDGTFVDTLIGDPG